MSQNEKIDKNCLSFLSHGCFKELEDFLNFRYFDTHRKEFTYARFPRNKFIDEVPVLHGVLSSWLKEIDKVYNSKYVTDFKNDLMSSSASVIKEYLVDNFHEVRIFLRANKLREFTCINRQDCICKKAS